MAMYQFSYLLMRRGLAKRSEWKNIVVGFVLIECEVTSDSTPKITEGDFKGSLSANNSGINGNVTTFVFMGW